MNSILHMYFTIRISKNQQLEVRGVNDTISHITSEVTLVCYLVAIRRVITRKMGASKLQVNFSCRLHKREAPLAVELNMRLLRYLF